MTTEYRASPEMTRSTAESAPRAVQAQATPAAPASPDQPELLLSDERVLTRRVHQRPAQGWRRLLGQLSGGLLRPGPSEAELRARRLIGTVTQPIEGSRTIAVISTKGGVGKTSTAVNVGHTFASLRGDRIVALDANPDAGSLGFRIRRETKASVNELVAALAEAEQAGNPAGLEHYAELAPFTSVAGSRLEVIASPEDPRLSRTLGRQDYQRVLELLRRHFTLILADCGTGILDPVTQGIVDGADQLIVVGAPSIDASRALSFLLSWLTEHGHERLVANAVLVMNGVPSRTGPVNLPQIERHFAQRVRTVVRIPKDEHLETGGRTSLEDLAPATRSAYLHLAACVADGLNAADTHFQ